MTSNWDPAPNAARRISPALAPLVECGPATGQFKLHEPWGTDLILRRSSTEDPRISFALTAAAAAWYPGVPVSYALERHTEIVSVSARGDPSNSREVRLTFSWDRRQPVPAVGIRAGDHLGQFYVAMPDDETLKASTMSFTDVLNASDAELASWFSNKVIVVGDERPERDGPFPHPDGRQFAGFYPQAVAINQLLMDRSIQRPRIRNVLGMKIWSQYLFDATGAAAGAAAGLLIIRGAPRRFAMAAIMLLIAIAVVLLFRTRLLLFQPLACALAAGTCCELVAVAERNRRRRAL
jgi:hypothetical protein